MPARPNHYLRRLFAALLLPLLCLTSAGFLHGQTVDTPEFAPEGADGQVPFQVTVTCPTAGATIRYTLDGVNPTATSLPVPVDGKILIGANLTLKAQAFKEGMTASAVKSADYRVTGAIDGGGAHVLALTPDGKLYAWGVQTLGRLGNGMTGVANVLTPTPVLKTGGTPLTNGVDISGGFQFSLAVTADGKVWACGDNSDGQLGSNSVTDSAYMQRVLKAAVTYASATEPDFLSGIVGVSAGHDFSVAVASDGKVWSWGQKARGRLGDGYVSTTVDQRRYAGLVTTGDAGNPPLANVVQVRSGRSFTLALTDLDSQGRGQLWAWGRNFEGQLGQGTTTDSGRALRVKRDATVGNWMDKVVDFAVGYDHAVAIRQDDAGNRTVWCWGEQANGRLGNGVLTSAVKSYPVQVLRSAGVPLTDVIQVAAAGRFTLALDRFGKVWSWGYNVDGELADGTVTQRAYAQPAKTSAGVDLTDVVFIGAGGHDFASPYPGFALAITSNGSLYGFGYNANGQTASGSTTPGNVVWATPSTFTTKFNNLAPTVSLAVNASSTSAPADFTLTATAADSDGTVASVDFYENDAHIGSDTNGAPWTLTVTNRPVGDYTLTAEAKDGLGAAGFANQTVSVVAPAPPPVAVPVAYPEGGGAVAIDQIAITSTEGATIHYTMTDDGEEPLDPNSNSSTIPANRLMRIPRNARIKFFAVKDGMAPSAVVSAAYPGKMRLAHGETTLLTKDGYIWRWGIGMPSSTLFPTLVPKLSNVIGISTGYDHNLAVLENGAVWSWGQNDLGQLGDGTTIAKPDPVKVVGLHNVIAVSAGYGWSAALGRDGRVWTWGYGLNGELGDGSLFRSTPAPIPLTNVVAIATGQEYGMALDSNGDVWVWGTGSVGQLGVGTPYLEVMPVRIAGFSNIVAISAGGSVSALLRSDGKILASGAFWNPDGTGNHVRTHVEVPALASLNLSVDLSVEFDSWSVIQKLSDAACWGGSVYGECAALPPQGEYTVAKTIPLSSAPFHAVEIAWRRTYALASNGDLWGWGALDYGSTGPDVAGTIYAPVRLLVFFPDIDNDNLPDDWEWSRKGSIDGDADTDSDGDGLSDAEEYLLGLDPMDRDHDDDGIFDGAEIALGTDPTSEDTDDDGVRDELDLYPKDDRRSQPLPPITLSLIDFSTLQGELEDVSLWIAVNDNDQVGFGGSTGDNYFASSSLFGANKKRSVLPQVVTAAGTSTSYSAVGVTPAGLMFGSAVKDDGSKYVFELAADSGGPSLLSPPGSPYDVFPVTRSDTGVIHGYITDLFDYPEEGQYWTKTFTGSLSSVQTNKHTISIQDASLDGRMVGIEQPPPNPETGNLPPPINWFWDGGLIALPPSASLPSGVNDSGDIVGGYGAEAYYYRDGLIVPLSSLIPQEFSKQLYIVRPLTISNRDEVTGFPIIDLEAYILEGTPEEWMSRTVRLEKALDESITVAPLMPITNVESMPQQSGIVPRKTSKNGTTVEVKANKAEVGAQVEWRPVYREEFLGFDAPMRNDFHPNVGEDFIVASGSTCYASLVYSGDGKTNQSVKVWFRSLEFGKKTKLVIPSASQNYIDVSPKDVALAPAAEANTLGFSERLTITVNPNLPPLDTMREATIELVGTEADKDGKFPLHLKLTVLIFPEVRVDLAIHWVDDPRRPNSVIQPVLIGSQQQVFDLINRYFRQVGVTFVPSSTSGPESIHFDDDGDGRVASRIKPAPEILVLKSDPRITGPGAAAKINVVVLRQSLADEQNMRMEDRTAGFTPVNPLNPSGLEGSQLYILSDFAGTDSDSVENIAKVIAHELGHAFTLSTRKNFHPGERAFQRNEGHDLGVFPFDGLPGGAKLDVREKGLMWPKGNDSRWMRNEDWRVGNIEARRFRLP